MKNQNSRPIKYFLWVLILTALNFSLLTCKSKVNRYEEFPITITGEAVQGISPGPDGTLIGADYRLPLLWLNSPGKHLAGDYGRWLRFDNRRRFYELHIPPQYRRGKKLPVLMVLHGGGGNPSIARFGSRMNEVSDKHGFIVLYPAGTGSDEIDRHLFWNSGPKRKDEELRDVNDVAFIAFVLDDLEKYFDVDKKRIYSTGLSNGAQMSFRLAAELSNRIAAAAPVSGDRTIGMFFSAPPRPVPVIYFHGTKDTYLGFEGGDTPSGSAFVNVVRPSVTETMVGWVKQAGGNPTHFENKRIGKALRYHYPPKDKKGVEVDYWVIEEGGHTWPGGRATKVETILGVGAINTDISASEVMWEFLKRQSL
jgi:polyhydroxybutyrate depolymerase